MYQIGPFRYRIGRQSSSREIYCDQSLIINEGDFVLITGDSGSGKTTLLKMFKGLIPEYSPQSIEGKFLFLDQPLGGDNFKRNLKKILFLFQNPFTQIIHPTVPEEFYFSMENFHYSREQMDSQKDKLSALFDLDKMWHQKTAHLSNGECQKLVLSSLLAIGPKVILMDEPTAFLDPVARKDFYQWLRQIKGQMTILLVDHHQKEVGELIDYCLLVNRSGKIEKKSMQEILHESHQEESQSLQGLLETRPKNVKQDFVLKVNDLNFSHNIKRTLLKQVSFEVQSGEVVVIKGENGAGKSTLFKIIAGFEGHSSKAISLFCHQKKMSEKNRLKMIGMIFQNPESHFFYDTIKEELGKSSDSEETQRLFKIFFHQIELNRSPFLMSEGEKRRLSILIALAMNKSILLYDEPTFGQDSRSKAEIAELIIKLRDRGIIQLIISHDEEFIAWVSDRVYQLKDATLEKVK